MVESQQLPLPHPTGQDRAARRQRDELFRDLVTGIDDSAIFLLTPQGRVASWNADAERIHGFRREEILGEHYSRFHTPEAIVNGSPAQNLLHASEQGRFAEEGSRIRKDGSRFRAGVILTPLVAGNAECSGYIAIIRDLSERRNSPERPPQVEERRRRVAEGGLPESLRRQNEARLQESEERFARFAEHLPGLAWIKDLEGRYVYVNHAAVQAFGATREVITGRTDGEIFPPDSAQAFRENDRRAMAGGTGIQVIEFLRDPQGSLRHSIVSKFPIRDAEGHPRLLGGIAIDITDRVHAEDALRRADRRKDEFLATLSHELRSPLAPIRTGLHILRHAGPGERADHIHEMLEHQLARLIRLVDDLLEVSRISGGRVELRKEPVEVGTIIKTAVETSLPLIEGASHHLSVALPVEPLVLEVDPIRLGQVLYNLLSNAAKYTADGGHIRVSAHRESEAAVISVRDDGIGIRADMLERVFDMFAQVDRTLKRAQGGLGIGLALSRNLVELHGGRIEAHSAGPNQGSEFIVRVPLSERRVEARTRTESGGDLAMPLTPQRILVVDDSKDGADSLGMVLKMMGAEAEVVYDGPSAIAAIRARRPATVLLDIGMPGMDGYEVAAEIRKDPAMSDLRLIALTGWGSEEERRRSHEAGFNDHWVKPVDPAKLRVLLEAASGAED